MCKNKAKKCLLRKKIDLSCIQSSVAFEWKEGVYHLLSHVLKKIIWSVAVLSGFVFLSDVAHLMCSERLYVWASVFEKYILYPAIILNALTTDAFSISNYRDFGTQ